MKILPFKISTQFIHVWQRNWRVYLKTWKINFIPPLLEPLLYILAFGLGLGTIVGNISYNNFKISYLVFITPALIAVSIMNTSFFENTYSSFVKMNYQKTFDAIMATPITLRDIITGEIFWGATKSVIATIIMLVIISLFGLIKYPSALLLIPISLLGGFAFGSIGMLFTSIIPNIESFNLPTFLFITPMFLFSDTFFPLTNLPLWAQKFSLLLPLTHLVQSCRACCLGKFNINIVFNIAYLIIFSLASFPLAIFNMQRRLIK